MKPATPLDGSFKMGTAIDPDGGSITVNSRYLLKNGSPWFPVMGEFHYSRYPENEWRDELLKMKAGGIDIAATYIFWIHHEEEEGVYRWDGRRDLRRFVELCQETGLLAVLRIGPWCHGEVRNGGLPDWLLEKGLRTRSNDDVYLNYVERFFHEISQQTEGLFWKDGGPVIGVQIENEFRGPAEHLMRLKEIAVRAGLDAPLYTRTGWPDLTSPIAPGEFLPLSGAYAEGFWDRSIESMPGKFWRTFIFEKVRSTGAIGTDQLGEQAPSSSPDYDWHPYLTCEMGGGMMSSYHRRIFFYPMDALSAILVKIGSGSNLPGYYMYHGGTNPDGKLSTLHESQATKYHNDLPVMSYDFQAPLGEFGQLRDHYHLLRRLHLFLHDFGAELAGMSADFPAQSPEDKNDAETPRWAVRSNGESGYVFVNNYQRLLPMPPKPDVSFDLPLESGTLHMPAKPVTVPANTCFYWPFNLDLDGVRLVYATAQPICRLQDAETTYAFFSAIPEIPVEFAIESKNVKFETAGDVETTTAGQTIIQNLTPGLQPAVQIEKQDGKKIYIILLDETASLHCWKEKIGGCEHVILTSAGLINDGGKLRLTSENPAELSLSMLPAPDALSCGDQTIKPVSDGVFSHYDLPCPAALKTAIHFEKIKDAEPPREIRNGSAGVAEAPSDEEYYQAAVWSIQFPEDINPGDDLLLRVWHTGDVARFTLDGKLLTDNFYNGKPFDLGLKHYAPEIYHGLLQFEALPMRQDAPILIPAEAQPDFEEKQSALEIHRMEIIKRHTIELRVH
ncbi:beta-galactosidase [Candidatus Sumerlaeota bacterium]|nr:beta-galactosidase [Candidatus Sumerlaeota bacterium]